jgi:integrase
MAATLIFTGLRASELRGLAWKDIDLTAGKTMSRVRGRIESVLAWATVRGYREGDNPARWRGHLSNLLARPAKKSQDEHHNAVPYATLPAFIAELRAKDGMPARALEFLILTAARRDEVRLARWSEIDLPGRVWIVPRRANEDWPGASGAAQRGRHHAP